MKTILIVFSFLMVSCGPSNKMFQEPTKKKVEIKTSAECGMCKSAIETKMNFINGIQFAELDVESKVLTVKYNTKKISLPEIKKQVSEIGYDADEVKANPESVKNLPNCCQPGGMDK